MCEVVVSAQQTELGYQCKKPRAELDSLERDVKAVIAAFPELLFDQFDSCFYLAAEEQTESMDGWPEDEKGTGVGTKRDCNSCCTIF